ncbi:MAG: extracellular solute-binding protein [Verrucomicrobiota bacterium]
MDHSSHPFTKPIGLLLLTMSAFLLSACAPASDSENEAAVAEDVVSPEEYYAANPEFFRFSTLEELPSDLNWQDGMDQPVFSSPDAIRGGTLRAFMLNFPPTVRLVGPDANHSMRSVFLDDNSVRLTTRHPVTGKFFAALAEEWAESDDKQTVYYRLRPEATFSDGEPVTTDDYFYLFYFMQSPYIRDLWYNNWYTEQFDGITRYDDRTFAIHLSGPKPEPLQVIDLKPVPAHFHGTMGPDWVTTNQWRFEPTTGPYELRPENRRQRSIRMTRVENWWADDHKFYRNRYNPTAKLYEVVPDFNLAYERFKKGDFDLFGLSLPEFWYERSEGVPEFERGLIRKAVFYNDIPQPSVGLWINSAKPLLSDLNIRKGIQHATNYDRVINRHFRGDFSRLNTSADGFGEFTHPELRAREFSPEKARQYFAEAGFTEQGPDGILRNSEGQRLGFSLLVSEGPRVDVAQILKEEARKAGLDLTILALEPTSAFKQVLEKQHDIVLSGWNSTLPYPRYWEGFHSSNANVPQTNNISNTAIPEMDVLIDQYRESTNLEEKIALAHRLEEFVHEDAAFVPGTKVPFYRVAFWAWIRFPEHFDVRLSESAGHHGLFWIDPELKEEILDERRGNSQRPNDILVFDEWKDPEI